MRNVIVSPLASAGAFMIVSMAVTARIFRQKEPAPGSASPLS